MKQNLRFGLIWDYSSMVNYMRHPWPNFLFSWRAPQFMNCTVYNYFEQHLVYANKSGKTDVVNLQFCFINFQNVHNVHCCHRDRDLPMEYYFSRYRFFSTIGIGIGRRLQRQIKSANLKSTFYQIFCSFLAPDHFGAVVSSVFNEF